MITIPASFRKHYIFVLSIFDSIDELWKVYVVSVLFANFWAPICAVARDIRSLANLGPLDLFHLVVDFR